MVLAYRFFGRTGYRLILHPVIAYFFLTNSAVRRASHQFLTRVHKNPTGKNAFHHAPDWRDVYWHLISFGDATLDKMAAWIGEINATNVTYQNLSLFEDMLRSGRGGLLIASHLGNAEVSRALGALVAGQKINVLVHTKHSENFNRVMRQINPKSTVDLIQVTDVDPAVAMMLNEKISNGEFVVIVGDRTPVVRNNQQSAPRVTWAPFLGQLAPFPQGPFILAGLLKCPVLTMFCLKREGRYHIIFESFADHIDVPRKTRESALEHWITRYAARLESYCLTDPFQWFNYFDFWLQAGRIRTSPVDKEVSKEGRKDI